MYVLCRTKTTLRILSCALQLTQQQVNQLQQADDEDVSEEDLRT